MEFTHRKLPAEAYKELRICKVATMAPFALMLAPVYVFMKLNKKFVSVKAPLDFFTPEELERLAPSVILFVPKFVDAVLPFRDAAHQVRALISLKPEEAQGKEPYPKVKL